MTGRGLKVAPRMSILALAAATVPVQAQDQAPPPRAEVLSEAQVARLEAAMTDAERTILTHGVLPIEIPGLSGPPPAGALPSAGYVPGIPRLAIPALTETDASLGIAYIGGIRKDGATALPSGLALASSWSPDLMRAGGAMIGKEARAKGFNVLLAGGVNLVREPRNGRNFEYLSEDPLLSGILGGASIAGIQSNGVISTIKHFAFNSQETGRAFYDVKIGEAAARESDLLAFEIAIEQGRPGSVMCAYNQVWGNHACSNDALLNRILKRDWGYRGWVMSDWGAVPALNAALNGLDQQSGEQLDPAVFFGDKLAQAAKSDKRYRLRLADMNRRILYSIHQVGVDPKAYPAMPIDFVANGAVAEDAAKQGIVLLRNSGNALPLAKSAQTIAVIGGYADSGVLSGGGSSQVQGVGGAAVNVPLTSDVQFPGSLTENYHRSVPLQALKRANPQATFTYRSGRYLSEAVDLAKRSDVVIVFATQWTTEGYDVPDLSLVNGQDGLIAAVAAANPRTIVVLETGGPVLMPWLDRTAAVIEAWYPGARGAEAIASVLYGDTNPSGRLPVTFPASTDQLPRPTLPGVTTVEPNLFGRGRPGQTLIVDHDIEGADVGYRWWARRGQKPLFSFGYGLSYTSFTHGPLRVSADASPTARVTVKNTGSRSGADVVQVYLLSGPNGATRRLAGFQRVNLSPGEERELTIPLERRVLANWRNGKWVIASGQYNLAVGSSADALEAPVSVAIKTESWGY